MRIIDAHSQCSASLLIVRTSGEPGGQVTGTGGQVTGTGGQVIGIGGQVRSEPVAKSCRNGWPSYAGIRIRPNRQFSPHVPCEHISPGAHAFPQVPQLSGSFEVSTHAWSHVEAGAAHSGLSEDE